MKNIQFINAGAGSGKTYFLTMKMADVVAQEKCSADEIILTTFTEKAAAELKDKAREALLAKGLRIQANLLSEAAIGTIHSVAYRLIQKYWYYLGVGIDLRVMPEADQSFFINQSLAFVPTQQELLRLNEICTSLNFQDGMISFADPDYWKKDLLKIIELSLNNQISDLSKSMENSYSEIDQIFQSKQDSIPDDKEIKFTLKRLSGILDSCADNQTNRVRKEKTIKLLAQSGNFRFSDYLSLSSLLNDLTKKIIAELDMAPHLLFQLDDIHHSFLLSDLLKEYVELIFGLAKISISEYKKYKQEHKLIDYNDMELYLLELLNHEGAREEVRHRYKMVFVDEFQDSSPIQVQIFNQLSDLMQRSYWVGDPKQAIYNFRGTDPLLIEAFINELNCKDNRNLSIGDPLGYSWRSRPKLVNLSNNIFSITLADQVGSENIALKPVRPDDELPENCSNAPIQHWHFIDHKGKKERLGHHLASEVNNLLSKNEVVVADKKRSNYDFDQKKTHAFARPLMPEDICILCRTTATVELYTESLKGFGIQVAAEQKSLTSKAEVSLFLALLNHQIDRNDALAKAIILLLADTKMNSSADLIDQRLTYLYGTDAIPKPEKDDEEYQILLHKYYRYKDSWGVENEMLKKSDLIRYQSQHLSLISLIDRLVSSSGINELIMLWDNPRQRQNNLEAIKKLALQYESRCLLMEIGSSIRGFVEFMTVWGHQDLLQGAASGTDAVNVMTYHKSKGLEWPVVILTELGYDHMSDKKLINRSFFGVNLDQTNPLDINNPFEGKSIVLLPWPFGSRMTTLPEDVSNEIVQSDRFKKQKENTKNEMRRLLYVGMTRARDVLITTSYHKDPVTWFDDILGHQNLKENLNNLSTEVKSTKLYETPDSVYSRVFDYEEEMDYPKMEKQIISVLEKKGPVPQDNPRIVSPSKTQPRENAKISLVKDFNFRITRAKSNSEDSIPGDCLHALFFLYRPETLDGDFVEKAKRMIINFDLENDLIHPTEIYTSAGNLYTFMDETYGKSIKVYKELPLQMEEDGYVYKGSADLVWETSKGIVLVDYKSYSGAIANVTNPSHDKYSGRYSGQLALYHKMLERSHPESKPVIDCLIYYAVIGAIVSISY
jgi:ATP-dependent helicase/nuclease subunit A